MNAEKRREKIAGARTPFNPSLVGHGRLKETGPTERATAVAKRETSVRIEKVSANAVRMRKALGKEDDEVADGGAWASEGGGGRKGVDSSSLSAASFTSSWSRAWRCGGGAGAAESRSCEDLGMLEATDGLLKNENKRVGRVARLSSVDLLVE